MNKNEATEYLIQMAKDRIQTIDAEWGCVHSFDEALELSKCDMHDEAVKLAEAIGALA